MARLLPLSHQVKDRLILGKLKVEIDLHAPLVGMGGHGVPDAARLQHGHAHGELAGGQHVGVDELVDDPPVGQSRVAAGPLGRVRQTQQARLIAAVGGGGDDVEFGGGGGIVAGEKDLLRAPGDVQAVLIAHGVDRPVHRHAAGAAQIEKTGLPPLQKEMGAEAGPHIDALLDGHRRAGGHAAHGHHAVHVAVHRRQLAGTEQGLDEKLPAQLLRGIALHILRICGITNIHSHSFLSKIR